MADSDQPIKQTGSGMLPEAHRQPYEEFYQSLQSFQQQCRTIEVPGSEIRSGFQQLQTLFQRCLNLDETVLDPDVALSVQSYQVEINKQLRLLSMDVMFLQSAKQSTTANQRRQQMSNRVDLLLRYGEAILQKTD